MISKSIAHFGLSLLVWAAAWVPTVTAEEPALEFLQSLRDKGLYDMADLYLDQMSTSKIVDEKFRQRIPIERAENLIQSTGTTKNIAVRLERLDKAEQILSEFEKSTPDAELRGSATETLANLRFYQARYYLMQCESDRITQAEKDQKFQMARQRFSESVAAYDQVRERLAAEVTRLTEQAKVNKKFVPELTRVQNAYTKIRLRSPLIKEYSADTYPVGDAKRNELLGEAIKEFEVLWDQYSRFSSGVDALLHAARCSNKLGKPADALAKLQEIFQLDDTAALRPLRQSAALIAIESWEATQPYPFSQVIANLEPFLPTLTKAEQRQADWARIQLELGKAYRAKAADMKANNNGTAADQSRANKTAAMLVKRAARSVGPTRDLARALLAEWNIDISDDGSESEGITTFAEAKEKALDMIIDLDSQNLELVNEMQRLAKADATQRADLEKAIEAKRSDLKTSAKEVMTVVQTAFQMLDKDVSPEDRNHLRYLQAYCFFVQDRLPEPAIIGEFLLEKNPGVEWSRQAAGLAVSAYAKMYEQADEATRHFELEKLSSLSERIVKRWPGSSEADKAATIMVRLAMARNDKATIEKYSQLLSERSGVKAAVGLKLAQQQWFEFKKSKKEMSAEEQAANSAELKAKVLEIIKALESGLGDVAPDRITFEAAYSSLLLVDALLEAGQFENAVKQLEEAPIAPLDLIKQKHQAIVESPNANVFMQGTYRSAINAYLASMRSGKDTQIWITKTQGVLTALKELLDQSDPANSAKQLSGIYALIASELRQQFASLSNPDERQNLAKNLAIFLDQLGKDSKDPRTMVWIATTLQETADALSGKEKPSDSAVSIYRQATEAFDRVIKADLSQLDQPADQLKIELRRRKALATAGSGAYEEAVKQFADLLSEKNALSYQVDAAKILQAWGKFGGKPNAYVDAMMGTAVKEDPKTKRKSKTIWGWRAIITSTRGKDELVETCHESVLNLIESQLEFGIAANRADAITAAAGELKNAKSRDPQLGGPKFKARYDRLEQLINQNQK